MLTDRAAVLRKVKDLRNLLDQLHKKGFRLKTCREGMALSRVTQILRESKAFRGECVQPRAIINSWDPDVSVALVLSKVGQVCWYLRKFEKHNRKVMGKNDRLAFNRVRWLLSKMADYETADDYYVGEILGHDKDWDW